MDIEREILAIKERNRKVEIDKAWETSFLRRASIVLITYLATLLILTLIGVPSPYLAALVPGAGYLLSTFSLPFLRGLWERYRR